MEIARADASVGDHAGRARVAGRDAVLPLRYRGAEAALSSCRSRAARCCGASASPSRRPGRDAGATQTRAELRDGRWIVNGTKAFITNSGTDITGGTTITAVTGVDERGRNEISNLDRAAGHARLHAFQDVSQDGLARIGYARAVVRRRRDSRGEPARPARARAQAVPDRARRRPHLGRRALGRPRAGRLRRGLHVRAGAPSVRAADLEVPGDPVQARRHEDGDRARRS